VWGATGSVDLGVIAQRVEEGAGFTGLLLGGLGLLGVGFAFKVGAVPFHMWTPDVYEGAPSPSTAFMASAVKAASFVAFLRVLLEGFSVLHGAWYPILWWLAALTMIVGNLIALSQSNVKRMLAYSSIAHGGYLLVGLAAANASAAGGVLFYLFVYTVMTVGSFGILMIVSQYGEERLQVEDYAGFGWDQPFLGVLFTIFLLALAGFPGTGGFMAKIFLLQGAAASGLWKLAILLALTTVVSYYYYLRLAWYMWMRPSPAGETPSYWVPLSTRAALLGIAAALLFLGVFPGQLLESALLAVQGLAAFAEPGVLTGGVP
jgi:NADH-quinone oxidoreductase subunit N